MNLRIALAGNPNSGKTTLFNALTGSNQFVGNWPGVTVEKKEGKIFVGGINVIGLIFAFAILGFMLYMLFRPYKEATKLTANVRIK